MFSEKMFNIEKEDDMTQFVIFSNTVKSENKNRERVQLEE
jgi:hypothetical protein